MGRKIGKVAPKIGKFCIFLDIFPNYSTDYYEIFCKMFRIVRGRFITIEIPHIRDLKMGSHRDFVSADRNRILFLFIQMIRLG